MGSAPQTSNGPGNAPAKDIDEEILKKNARLQELMEKLITEELQELLKELEKLMDNMNKEDLMENLEDLEMSEEELAKELERMLELFKQLELEQKMKDTIEDLEELAEDQTGGTRSISNRSRRSPTGSPIWSSIRCSCSSSMSCTVCFCGPTRRMRDGPRSWWWRVVIRSAKMPTERRI